VFYVIYIGASLQAPHFINNRKGCYIRTDEYSQRFEPRLATYEELRFLIDRRQEALSLREHIIARALARFERNAFVSHSRQLKYSATMSLTVVPYFPGPFSLGIIDLKQAILASQLRARGGNEFPGPGLKSAHESFYHPEPRVGLAIAYFEATVHGLLFYGQELAERASPEKQKRSIRSDYTFAWLIFYLKYAAAFYRNAGYDGDLHVELLFERLEGIGFTLVHAEASEIGEGKNLSAELDDTVHITVEINTKILQEPRGFDELIRELVRKIAHAFGWAEAFAVEDSIIDDYILGATQYLMLEK
jgi:hypothetical protein